MMMWEEIERRVLDGVETPAADYWGAVIDRTHVEKYLFASRRRFRLLFEEVERIARRGARVCEIGPAYGVTLLGLQRRGFQVCAAEMPESMLYCWALRHAGVQIEPWDIHKTEAPYAPGSIDVVICSEVVEHLQINLRAAVRKLAALVRPGGNLVVTTPNLYSLPHLVRIVRGINIVEDFGDEAVQKNGVVIDSRAHPREATMRELIEAVRLAGFRIDKRDCFNSAPHPFLKRLAFSLVPRRCRDHLLVTAKRGDRAGG